MKLSIRFKFSLIFVGIIFVMIFAISLANQYLLEPYVMVRKQNRMLELKELVEVYVLSGLTEDKKSEVERECRIANVQVMVFDNTSNGMGKILVSSDFFSAPGAFERLDQYEQGLEVPMAEVYELGEDYALYRTGDRWSDNQLECMGSVEGCFYYVLSTPLRSIRESVRQTNYFLRVVGIAAAIIGGIVVFFVTGTLTEPIKELAHLSEQMANQNFEVRYTKNRGDEIGQLGMSMNHMSENLKKVIGELRAANEQLEADIREKEIIDERRREFISNVSHELKTPIALIQGYSEGLKEGISDDPESREYYCDVIIDEAGKMNTIVRRLMNLGEIESGEIKLDKEDFNLSELISGVLNSASVLCQDKDVRMRLDAPGDLNVCADQLMIEEVLQNYISNACHHVGDPGEIVVTARPGTGGRGAHVEVYNSGSHIPEQDLERIWDKFFKVDRSHARKYGGSGIGLSIVKAIITAHNGQIGAVNRDDGVCFWFEL